MQFIKKIKNILFRNTVSFKQIDPIDDGLKEAIAVEQSEPDAIKLKDEIDSNQLRNYWQSVGNNDDTGLDWLDNTDN